MTDMLVKLYDLPPLTPVIQRQTEQSITIRRAIAPEKHHVTNWIRHHFSDFWVSETEVAFTRQPISCYIATHQPTDQEQLIGFGVYDTTALGFFGPTGVSEPARGRGTGAALLLTCLYDMLQKGYGYAIIGGVGPVDFYTHHARATVIPDSTPGIYKGLLRTSQ